ncbi:MAG TPA: phosphotransferase [Myxococcaceae bacterium]|nr:phosphotransferase [Myxococcaceae bacterium]
MTSPVSLSDLPDYLKRQRWFGGKAWPIKSADVLDFLTVPSAHPSPFMLAVIEVTYELGHPERYVLSVTVPGARLEEALDHDANVQALFRLIRDGASIDSAGGTLVGEAFNAGAIPTSDTPDVRRLGVDQTNTSVVLGEAAILKVIRRMEPGANPEVEIGRTLQERTAFRAMPELLGTLQLDSQGPMTLAVLHRFIPNATDGWKFVTSALEQGAPTPALFEALHDLGRVVGELHVALASITDLPGFAPEPLQGDDLQRWSSNVVGELGVTLAQASGVAPDLQSMREELVERARELASAKPSGQLIRVHGDLHLGQVLRAEGRWLIFDFEGEPRRSFNQRREKTSALKDLAGMLRSLDYASASSGQSEEARTEFLRRGREAVLKGYLEATRGAGFLPEDKETRKALLRAFELEKLLYELRYEIANRPDWVRIPVEALRRLDGAQEA